MQIELSYFLIWANGDHRIVPIKKTTIHKPRFPRISILDEPDLDESDLAESELAEFHLIKSHFSDSHICLVGKLKLLWAILICK